MKTNNGRKPKSIGSTILVLVLALAYLAAKPKIDQWLGRNDAGKANSTAAVDEDDSKSSGPVNLDDLKQIPLPKREPSQSATPKQATKTTSRPQTAPKQPATESVLTKVGREYRSKAGLVYGPGKEHRRDHVLRHAKDDLSKPAHGVFDDGDAVFALVDEAYEKVKKKSRDVKSTKQRDRMAHVVKMHRRIGYKGGRNGNGGSLNRIKLILVEGNKVITAYPY